MQGFKDVANAGQALAAQGRGGADAYEFLKNLAMLRAQSAKTPEEKERAAKELQNLETMAAQTGMKNWTPQQLQQESLELKDTLDKQDPNILKQMLHNQGSKEVANIYATSRENVASAKGSGKSWQTAYEKLPPDTKLTTARSALASDTNPYTGEPLTDVERVKFQSDLNTSQAISNKNAAVRFQPGIDINAQTKGKVPMTSAPTLDLSDRPEFIYRKGKKYKRTDGGYIPAD
jgi:hypothetical protein